MSHQLVCLYVPTIGLSVCQNKSVCLFKAPIVQLYLRCRSICLSLVQTLHLSSAVCPIVFLSFFLFNSQSIVLYNCLYICTFVFRPTVNCQLLCCKMVSPSVCQTFSSGCQTVHPFVCLSNCQSIRLSIYPTVSPSVCLSIHLSAHLYVCLYNCQPIRLSVYSTTSPFVCLSIQLSDHPSVCLPNYQPFRLSVYLTVSPSVCLSIQLSVYVSVRLSVYTTVWLSVCLSLSVCLCVYSTVSPSVCLFIHLSVRLSVSVCPTMCLFIFVTTMKLFHTHLYLHRELVCQNFGICTKEVGKEGEKRKE